MTPADGAQVFSARTPLSAPYVPALDGLRGLSAQVVFLAHAVAFQLPAQSAALALMGWLARVAVIVFFVISGFAIAVSVARIGRDHGGCFELGTFAAHRLARVYPPYLASLLLVWTIAALLPAGTLAERGLPSGGGPGLGEVLRALAFANTKDDLVTRLNGPLWSLRIEVALYVLAACAVVAAQRRGPLRALALGAGGALAAAVAARLYFGLPAIILFGAGALAFWARAVRVPASLSADRAALALVGAVALGAIPVARFDLLNLASFSWAGTLIQLGVGLVTAVLVFQLSREEGRIGRQLARARPLGSFAYTLYVVHVPLLALGAACLTPLAPTARPVVAVAVLAATELASLGIARVLERPAWYRRRIGVLLGRP